jgi:DNA ligase (NAD+)
LSSYERGFLDGNVNLIIFMLFFHYTGSRIHGDTGVGGLPGTTKTQWDTLLLLKELGFAVNDDNRRFESFDAALQYARRWQDTRLTLMYEADGVVFKIDDLVPQLELGSVGGAPRWAVAWKFAAMEAVTVLEAIDLSIGRSGAIIPTAKLKVAAS